MGEPKGWQVALTSHGVVPARPLTLEDVVARAIDPAPYVDFTIIHDGVPVLTISHGVTTVHAPGMRGFGEALDRLNRLEQVGFVKWDGDEFYSFIYGKRRERVPDGFLPVFVESPDSKEGLL